MATKIAFRADRLRRLREQHGWSQRELCRRCGFSEVQIRNYENGQVDPSSTYLKAMAEQLGVSTDYLLGATDNHQEHINDGLIDEDERTVLETLRREGWLGLARLSIERASKEAE